MTPDAIDLTLIETLFSRLAEPDSDQVGITRDAYGPGEQRAHELFLETARELGLEIERDAAGNHFAICPGGDRALPAWVIGSHLDSVPQGGNYDGAAGVIAGLAAVAALRSRGITPVRDIIVAAFRAEESTWFPASYLGSRSALGRLDSEELALLRADSGRTLADHMRDCGGDPEAVAAGDNWLGRRTLHGMLELHIEQGPTLETEATALGIVTGIAGSFRYRQARCFGEWGHSGAVAKPYRHDALMAFSEVAMALEARWEALEQAGRRATVTVGQIATPPEQHAFSKIPGEVGFCLDVRSEEPATLKELEEALFEITDRVAKKRGVRFDLGPRSASTPAPMDPTLTARCQAIASELKIAHRRLPSGAGHDAATFANAGIPTQMLFVRNQHGSHNPFEAMRIEDFVEGVRVLAALIQE
ncbi:Zn-dependent hydrolase [Salinicola rhizosphaerae]|uniref:Zn-dependent hydrolase n=1 Tax=Salinicola rhizosphaerae TaxID=1443141 RepID=A0ABQ3DW72_9GAMM|nr:Zn-dependent hydrolase [Salinicola rhizosphaerae]GHB18144.1 Zn-dependent hydrolase [Salinicola rhizosphaerae]